MGLLCSRSRHHTEDTDENAQVPFPYIYMHKIREHYLVKP